MKLGLTITCAVRSHHSALPSYATSRYDLALPIRNMRNASLEHMTAAKGLFAHEAV